MLRKLFGPTHTFKEALLLLEEGLRSGTITVVDPTDTEAAPVAGQAVPTKTLIVGNLPYTVTDSDLRIMFEPFGVVQSAHVVVDQDAKRQEGFGFVEMGSPQEAQAAIQSMQEIEIGGRKLIVNEARPR